MSVLSLFGTISVGYQWSYEVFVVVLKCKVWVMNNLERKLLILVHKDLYDETAIEKEAQELHQLLTKTEKQILHTVEYVNLHRGGITQNKIRIENALRRPALGAFQFILHKN